MTTDANADTLALSFEDIGLRVGLPLTMRPVDKTMTPARYQVEYVGSLRRKSLLVTLPVDGGKGLWLRSGQEFVFTAVEGMYVYAFTSQVLRARSNPFPYVHFSYPKKIDARQVRKSYRIKMRLPAAAAGHDGAREAVLVLDLSMTGALLEGPTNAWQAGDSFSLALPITLEEAHGDLDLPATVRNRAEKQDGKCAHYGVEFAALPQNDALLLHYFIDHAIAVRMGQ